MKQFREELGRDLFWDYEESLERKSRDDLPFYAHAPVLRTRGQFPLTPLERNETENQNEALEFTSLLSLDNHGWRWRKENLALKKTQVKRTIARFRNDDDFRQSLGPATELFSSKAMLSRKRAGVPSPVNMANYESVPQTTKNILMQWNRYGESNLNPDCKPSLFPLAEHIEDW